MKTWIAIALVLGCGLALPAAELEGPDDCHYGVRLITSEPAQDFRDITGRTGFGAGLFAENHLDPSTVLQTRFDYISYPQTNQPGGSNLANLTVPNPLTLSANSTSVGVELRRKLPFSGLERVSLLGGVMGIRYEFDTSSVSTLIDQNGLPIPGIVRTKQKTSVKLGLAVGVAVEFYRGLSLAERYTTIDIDGTTFGTLETSLSYRF